MGKSKGSEAWFGETSKSLDTTLTLVDVEFRLVISQEQQ